MRRAQEEGSALGASAILKGEMGGNTEKGPGREVKNRKGGALTGWRSRP